MARLLNTKQVSHIHPHDSAFKIEGVTFGYTKNSKQLDNVSFEIHKKE